MKYIIMCGGTYGHFETPKHFSKVNGERLVERTIRLLKENEIEDIAISSLDPRFDVFGVKRLEHKNNFVLKNGKKESGYWVDAFYPSKEPMTYLFGDVYYSDYAIETIVKTETNDVLFFGSKNIHHPKYFKRWEEPFAFKVVNQERFRSAIDKCKELCDKGKTNREPIAWELYRVLNDYDINTHIIDNNFIPIDDYTTDIDDEKDIEKLEEILREN